MISYTDHQAVSLKIRKQSNIKGKGYCKLNNSILNLEDYKVLIKKLILEYKEKETLTSDPRILWDLFKSEVGDVIDIL